jgi:hypothetical protein
MASVLKQDLQSCAHAENGDYKFPESNGFCARAGFAILRSCGKRGLQIPSEHRLLCSSRFCNPALKRYTGVTDPLRESPAVLEQDL